MFVWTMKEYLHTGHEDREWDRNRFISHKRCLHIKTKFYRIYRTFYYLQVNTEKRKISSLTFNAKIGFFSDINPTDRISTHRRSDVNPKHVTTVFRHSSVFNSRFNISQGTPKRQLYEIWEIAWKRSWNRSMHTTTIIHLTKRQQQRFERLDDSAYRHH